MIKRELEAESLPIQGAFIIRPKEFEDERGTFFKLYNEEILSPRGAGSNFVEEYLSISKKGSLRGFHYQSGEFAQAKLVRCVRGEVFDVIVDMDSRSPSFGRWHSVVLSEENMLGLYVPRTCAHAFLATKDMSQLLYKADRGYSPDHEAGFRWDDPALGVAWPKMDYLLSDKDRRWPSFADAPRF